MADPFALNTDTHVLHPALSMCNTLPIGFFDPLVSDFLQDEKYVKWSAGYKPWQLHCYGSPGCGKSTFAVRVVEDLRQRYGDKGIFVAHIHIKERVSDHHAFFIEDFLFCLYKQICTRPAYSYERACRTGQASSERLKRIRAALHQQLTENEHNFLIFDGYDTLDLATCLLIDYELKDPGLSNLSLLVTRRNPPYERPEHLNVCCDNCPREQLDLYWECQFCGQAGPQYCCECKDTGILCTNNEHKLALSEPYDRIDLDMTKTSESAMVEFVTRELKTYSELRTQAAVRVASDISLRAGGNINLAKLRIDDLLTVDTPTDSETLRDRLPRNVVAFFDAEIENLLQCNPVDRDLGLMAIAAVAEYGNTRHGLKVTDLEQSMRREQTSSPHLARCLSRSLEDIITAANGLIVLQPYGDDLHVECFNPMFKLYVKEDYNESLHSAKSKLCLGEDHIQHAKPGLWNIAPSTTSPPTMSDTFDKKDYMDARSTSQDSAYYSRSSTMNTTRDNCPKVPHAVEPKGIFEHIGTLPAQSSVEEDLNEVREEIVPSLTLCVFCKERVLGDSDSSGDHHKSSEAIRNSLIGKCYICTDLYQHVSTADSMELHSHSYHCRYKWAIRSTGRSHNTESSYQVIFTPESNSQVALASKVPTKIYHILSETDVHVASEETLLPSTDPNKLGGGLQIREWMRLCDETHENCKKNQKSNFVPTRLVDLEVGDSNRVRIVNTAKESITGPYLTLSHSWGPPTFLQLKKENESRLMGTGVMITELTPNFQQTISVAKFMGMRYIWIDSLCIMQGPGGDFQSEGQLMHKVYRYSHCNIAVADSSDSEGGLFRQRKPSNIVPISFEADGSGKLERGTWRILKNDLWDDELLATKIYTRGWVFQERMLAPRIIHFAVSQIFWDCSTLSACEALPRGLPQALDAIASTDRHWRGRMQQMTIEASSKHQQPLIGANDDSMETFWRSALLNYTSCNLTNQGDKSVAIWSIAKLVRDNLGDVYGGGLWEANLEEQLAWHARDLAKEGCSRIPELQTRYPSWSWASMKGPIIARSRLPKARQYTVTNHAGGAIAFKSHSKDENEEPRLERVPMALSGYVAQGKYWLKSGIPNLDLMVHGSDHQESAGRFDILLDEALPDISKPDPAPHSFIILAATATSANGSRPILPSQNSGSRSFNRSRNTVHVESTDLTPSTYSGIALLLTPAKVYKAFQDENFKRLLEEVVVRSPDKHWPDPPYGQGKSLVDRTTDMRMLVATLRHSLRYVKEKGGHEDSLHRRIGAIEFRDMSEETWKAIVKEGKSKIWLD